MKMLYAFLIAATLALAGCEYTAPLNDEHEIDISPNVLGHWQENSTNESDSPDQMIILRASDTEYLVHYIVGADSMYFRAYPINIAGIDCVQLELIGDAKGNPGQAQAKRYHVVRYELVDEQLVISTLNTAIVSTELDSMRKLRRAFSENKNNLDLFHDPGRFSKVLHGQ